MCHLGEWNTKPRPPWTIPPLGTGNLSTTTPHLAFSSLFRPLPLPPPHLLPPLLHAPGLQGSSWASCASRSSFSCSSSSSFTSLPSKASSLGPNLSKSKLIWQSWVRLLASGERQTFPRLDPVTCKPTLLFFYRNLAHTSYYDVCWSDLPKRDVARHSHRFFFGAEKQQGWRCEYQSRRHIKPIDCSKTRFQLRFTEIRGGQRKVRLKRSNPFPLRSNRGYRS